MKKGLGLFTFFAKKDPVSVKDAPYVLYADTQTKMGTFVNMQCLSQSRDLAEECTAQAFLRIDELERIFSRHDSASLLSVLNAQGSLWDFPVEFKTVLEQSLAAEKLTFGAFNPSVLPVLEYLERHKQINGKELQEHFSRIIREPFVCGDNKIFLKQSGSTLTLDAIAKGYIVDCAAAVFEQKGIHNYLINAGGDIRVKGMKSLEKGREKTWRIAIEDPYKQGNYPAVFSLMRGALATSGNYEKNFGADRHHIILPSIRETDEQEKRLVLSGSSEHTSPTVKSVSVIAPDAMQADAYATAISCMPVDVALEYVNAHAELACMIIAADDSVHKSKNWIIR